jgi:serine/threonine-protein kinase
VILYQMLVGEVPFNDPSAPAILVKHLTEVPVPPSAKRPDRRIDATLESITMRCLEKKPDARFQSADELASALAAVPVEAEDFDGPTVVITPTSGGPLPKTITARRAVATPPVMARTMETPRVTATIPGTTVIRQNTALVPNAPQTLAQTVVDVPAPRRPRQLAYAAVLLVIAVAAGAAAFISRSGERTPPDSEPRPAAAVTPPVTQTPVTQTPVVVPPQTAPPSAGVTPPPGAAPAAPAQAPPALPPVAPPAQKNAAPVAAESGTPLSRQLTSRVRALLSEQKIDSRRLRAVNLEMSTRPSPLGRGITADYVATVRTPAGERIFSGNHLGFSELALRTEVIEKVAAEIVAYLASLP